MSVHPSLQCRKGRSNTKVRQSIKVEEQNFAVANLIPSFLLVNSSASFVRHVPAGSNTDYRSSKQVTACEPSVLSRPVRGELFAPQNLRIPPNNSCKRPIKGRSVCVLPLTDLHFPPKPRSLDKTLCEPALMYVKRFTWCFLCCVTSLTLLEDTYPVNLRTCVFSA
jgi:hypothetical protein